MATEREDVQHAYEMVRQSVAEGDALMRSLADDIQRVVRRSVVRVGTLTPADRGAVMRALDPVLWQYFGKTRRVAAESPLYRLIERRATITGITGARRAWDDLDRMMRETDPALWQRLQAYLAAAPLNERDGLMATYAMLFGPQVDQQRLINSRILDPMRRWVDPNGYRLSTRVWRVGPRIRAGIDARIIAGIQRGESAESIARAIREYVDPDYAPIRYQRNGRIIRTAAGRQQRSATEAARTLVRTEISRVHGVATVERAADVPGILGVRWRLSGSHPAQDSCNPLAEQDLYGLGRGVYPLDRVPAHPAHPRCLCLLLHVHKSRDETRAEIVEKYRATALGDLA